MTSHRHPCPFCLHTEPCPDPAKCAEAGTREVGVMCGSVDCARLARIAKMAEGGK